MDFKGQAYGVYLGMVPDRFTLNGKVQNQDGNPVPGILIETSGQPAAVAPVTTESDGSFSLELRPRSSYTVKPVTPGYTYTPLNASAWGDYGAVSTQYFTAMPIMHLKGDINGDGLVDLADAILALRIMAGMNPDGIVANSTSSGVDANDDHKIGLEEVVYILQRVAGMRP